MSWIWYVVKQKRQSVNNLFQISPKNLNGNTRNLTKQYTCNYKPAFLQTRMRLSMETPILTVRMKFRLASALFAGALEGLISPAPT